MSPTQPDSNPPQPNLPVYGIEKLFIFPVYNSPNQYNTAMGTDAPPYDPNKRIKLWTRTPLAGEDPELDTVALLMIPVKDTSYFPETNPDGTPALKKVYLSVGEAASVNIPPSFTPVGKPAMGVPIRALLPNESVTVDAFDSWHVLVHRADMTPVVPGPSAGFTADDHQRLIHVEQLLLTLLTYPPNKPAN